MRAGCCASPCCFDGFERIYNNKSGTNRWTIEFIIPLPFPQLPFGVFLPVIHFHINIENIERERERENALT